jgi:hypothetical protein
MHRPRSFPRTRRAIASLELVLVLPFVLAMAGMLLVFARADVNKVAAATATRQQTWRNRPSADGGGALRLAQQPQRSEVSSAPKFALPVGKAIAGQIQPATSSNTVIGNTWNFAEVKFQPLPQNLQPHTDEIGKVASDLPDPAPDALKKSFKALLLFDPNSDHALMAAAALGQTGDVATKLAGELLHIVDLLNKLGEGLDIADWMLSAAEDTGIGGIIGGIGSLVGVDDPVGKLKDAIHQLKKAFDALDGLYRASQGRD